MKKVVLIGFILLVNLSLRAQYAPKVGEKGTTAIYKDSSIIVAWATGYKDIVYGEDVDEQWKTPEKALGKAEGTSGDIVCLGRRGEITFTFDRPIVNKKGPDFVTFENALSDTFLELGWVEVSKDGTNFIRFPNRSLTEEPVNAFGDVDPTKINGYCSKYKQAYGTPFDLDSVDLDTVRYVKLIDIAGDGNSYDSDGRVIYDPYKTTGSAGLDVDAIGIIHAGELKENIDKISHPNLKIFPNPANNYFIVENSKLQILNLEILNLTGKVIEQYSLRELISKIKTENLRNGIYFVRLNSNNGIVVKKLIIKH
jgi:hypothetical protein